MSKTWAEQVREQMDDGFSPRILWKEVQWLMIDTEERLSDTGIVKVEKKLSRACKALKDLRKRTIDIVCTEAEKIGGSFWGIRIEPAKRVDKRSWIQAKSGPAIFTFSRKHVPVGSFNCEWIGEGDIPTILKIAPDEDLPTFIDDVGDENDDAHRLLRKRFQGILSQLPERQDLMDLYAECEHKSRRLYWITGCCTELLKQYAFELHRPTTWSTPSIYRLWFGKREYIFVRGTVSNDGCILDPDTPVYERKFDVE